VTQHGNAYTFRINELFQQCIKAIDIYSSMATTVFQITLNAMNLIRLHINYRVLHACMQHASSYNSNQDVVSVNLLMLQPKELYS